MNDSRWFGREPALVLQAIAAALTLLIGFGVPGLNDNLAGAIMAFLTAAAAVWTALHVRPVAPTIFSGLIAAATALVSTFWVDITQAQTALITSFVAVLVTLITRPQQTYLDPGGPATEARISQRARA